jgi:hypothetical protein
MQAKDLSHIMYRLAAIFCIVALTGLGTGVYQEPSEFLAESFDGDVPSSRSLWIVRDMREDVQAILGHPLRAMRVRYWQRDGRTAFVLEEIGKTEPITVGLVVEGGRLTRMKVLEFRESRGWEVRYPSFTDQFRGAGITESRKLDRDIDGVSGATLSVRALTKLARLALYLEGHCPADAS